MLTTAIAIFSLLANLFFIWSIKRMTPAYNLGTYIANGIVSGKIKTVRSDEIEIKPIAKSTNTPH